MRRAEGGQRRDGRGGGDAAPSQWRAIHPEAECATRCTRGAAFPARVAAPTLPGASAATAEAAAKADTSPPPAAAAAVATSSAATAVATASVMRVRYQGSAPSTVSVPDQ